MNSSKPWRKGVLVSCVAVFLFATVSLVDAQTPEFIDGPPYALQAFEASASGQLTGVGFWSDDSAEYEVVIYDTFSLATGLPASGPLRSGWGNVPEAGYHTVDFTSPLNLSAGDPFFVGVYLDSWFHAASFDSPQPDNSFFTEDAYLPEAVWYDLFDDYSQYQHGGNALAVPANFLFTPLVSWDSPDPNIWVNQTHPVGNWDIEDEQFDGTATLAVDIKANDYGPFDTEIGVQGGMNPIFIDGRIFNDTGEDWPGMVLQLGHGLGGDFELATDVFFPDGQGGLSNELVIDSTVLNGQWELFPEPIPIGLPQGADDPFFFTLRAYAIPEPGSLLLLAFAALGLLALRRR